MIKWEGLRLYVFRKSGKNIIVAAQTLTEARKVAGADTRHYDHVDCTLIITEGVFAERTDVNEGQEP